MSKLEQLIKKYCPDGIEYKKLDDIATNWFRGSGIKRDEVTDSGQPCVRYGELYTTYGLFFDCCISHTSINVLPNPKVARKGAILFALTGESVEDIATSTAYIGEEDIFVGGDLLVMEHEQNAKYLSYALSTDEARMQKTKGKVKSKVVHSSKESISQIVIPIPPISVQEEMVRILDNYLELEKELEMKKKQFDYYHNKLFSFTYTNNG